MRADNKELSPEKAVKISCARCARVSYLTHAGVRNLSADLDLHDKLLEPGHMSPFEHAATPLSVEDLGKSSVMYSRRNEIRPQHAFCGNFRGWMSYRKTIRGEDDILGFRENVQL